MEHRPRRVTIGHRRWLELRDGLFYYVRIRGHWALDISVAPMERVAVAKRSQPPTLRQIPWVAYAALLAGPVFCITMLVLLSRDRSQPLNTLGHAFLWAGGITCLLALALFLLARLKGQLETSVYMAMEGWSHLVTFPHREGDSAEMDAFLDQLPPKGVTQGDSVPLGAQMTVATLLRDLGWTGVLWGSWVLNGLLQIALTPAGLGLPVPVALFLGCFFALPVGSICFVHLSCPKPLRAVRAALLDGDIDAAALMLDRFLDGNPAHPYGNRLLMAMAMLRGDFTQAAACAETVQASRLMRWTRLPGSSMTTWVPSPESLRRLAVHTVKTEGPDEALGGFTMTAIPGGGLR